MKINKNHEGQSKQAHVLNPNEIVKQSQAKLENDYDMDFMIKIPQQALSSSIKKTANSACSRKQSAKNSTAKYRQKKKKQIADLQLIVKNLQSELMNTEQAIQNVKQNILVGLQTLAKMNQRPSNQNVQIYNQLESLLGKSDPSKSQQIQIESFAVDFDKVNLLLDTLKYRIGASGRERQSKLDYQFKSIVNTLFPALYRYILLCCVQKRDFFAQKNQRNIEWEWTSQLINKMNIQPSQMQFIQKFCTRLENVYEGTNQGVMKLKKIKQGLKQEGLKIQGIQQQFRLILNPIQCAHWTLFSEKYKYRKQLQLATNFMPNIERIKQQEIQQQIIKHMKGTKRVKLMKQSKQ